MPMNVIMNMVSMDKRTPRLAINMAKRNTKFKLRTEQLLPSPNGARLQFGSTLMKDHDADINVRVLLLAPWPEDVPPFAKSLIYLRSQSGAIRTEVNRLPGVSDHFFRLYATSRKSDVNVALPSNFRGSVTIEKCDKQVGAARSNRVRFTDSFRARVRSGAIRINPIDAYEDEDEVYVSAPGRINFDLLDDSAVNARPVWRAADRIHRFKSMFKLSV